MTGRRDLRAVSVVAHAWDTDLETVRSVPATFYELRLTLGFQWRDVLESLRGGEMPIRVRLARLRLDIVCALRGHRWYYTASDHRAWWAGCGGCCRYCTRCGKSKHDLSGRRG